MLDNAARDAFECIDFRQLIAESPLPELVLVDLCPVLASAAFAKLLGYDASAQVLSHRGLAELFDRPEEVKQRIAEILSGRGGPLWGRFESEAVRADGSTFWVELTVRHVDLSGTVAAHCSLQDTTERRSREARVRELNVGLLDQARSSAIRETANALLHRLNQPRAAMLNYLGAARISMRRGGDTDEAQALLQHALSEGERIHMVLAGVEEIAAADQSERDLVDLNEIALDVCRSANAYSGGSRLPVTLRIADAIGPVSVRQNQIRRALLHLTLCGIEGAANASGCITLRTMHCGYGARAFSLSAEGAGVSPPDRIDLELVAAVADANGGWLEAHSEPGRVDLSVILPEPAVADAPFRR